jgi:hypothetical protein
VNSSDLLIDGFDRVAQTAGRVLNGADPALLSYRADQDANSIAWLIWHLSRVQDDHLADAFDAEQVWTSQDWVKRFDLPFEPSATGYGQRRDEVAQVQAPAGLLQGYLDAVHTQTVDHLKAVRDADLDRVVDTAWDPPVTLGVRLISVISDGLQHAGQAAFVRGIAERR